MAVSGVISPVFPTFKPKLPDILPNSPEKSYKTAYLDRRTLVGGRDLIPLLSVAVILLVVVIFFLGLPQVNSFRSPVKRDMIFAPI